MTYEENAERLEVAEESGARIPYPSPEDLLRMKRTGRPQDVADCAFLERLCQEQT